MTERMGISLIAILLAALGGCSHVPEVSPVVLLTDLFVSSTAGPAALESSGVERNQNSTETHAKKSTADKSPVSGAQLEKAPTTVGLDPSLLQPCSALPMMKNKNPTPVQVLEHKALETLKYAECAKRHFSLARLVRLAFNIPQENHRAVTARPDLLPMK